MQERQTQVLARPARAEGRDRETEGILKKVPLGGSRQKSTVFPDIPAGSMQAALATQIHARRARCTEGGKGALLSFPLSDGLSQSPRI